MIFHATWAKLESGRWFWLGILGGSVPTRWLKTLNLGTGLSRHAWPNQRQHVQPFSIWVCNGSPPTLAILVLSMEAASQRHSRFHQNLSKQKIQDSNHFPNNCYLYTMWKTRNNKRNGNGKSFIKRIMRKFSEVSSKTKITKTFRYLQSNLLRKPKKRTRCNIKQPNLSHQALSSISPKVQRTPHRNRHAWCRGSERELGDVKIST